MQLVAGGSGIVPLMCMLRTRSRSAVTAPARLLYSVRAPDSAWYTTELHQLAADGSNGVTYTYTRTPPAGWPHPAARVDAELIAREALPPSLAPTCYVCGPTGFVEAVADLLIAAGHDPARIRTERFGPSGGQSMTDPPYLDGNAAAGPLGMVFAVDLTSAIGRCTGCGRTGVLADTRVYAPGLGLVVRCVGCDRVLLRLVEGPRHTWLDLRGLAYLQLATPEADQATSES